MGLFLSLSGVIGCRCDEVEAALRAYAEDFGGVLENAELKLDDENCLVISEGLAGVSVLYPGVFFDWDNAAEFMSRRLHKPVFSFHIHDGDLWMYTLYDGGEVVDQFNPVPDYWSEPDDAERDAWMGNAHEVAIRFPEVSPEQISKYLVVWGDDVFESETRTKAYATDEFYYGDDWQLVDFMKTLGLDFPVDDRGDPHGCTYRFQCEPPDIS